MKPVFSWPGGKAAVAPFIAKIVDDVIDSIGTKGTGGGEDHVRYVEPFGGSFIVGLHVTKAPVKVHNDISHVPRWIYEGLLADHVRFVHTFELLPISKELYDSFVAKTPEELEAMDPVERGVLCLYLIQLSFNKKSPMVTKGGGNAFSYKSNRGDFLKYGGKSYEAAVKALNHVMFLNLDYRDVLKRYSESNTVVFADPPYSGTSVGESYIGTYRDGDFLEDVAASQATFVITHGDSLKKPLEDMGFVPEKFDHHSNAKWVPDYVSVRRGTAKKRARQTTLEKFREGSD